MNKKKVIQEYLAGIPVVKIAKSHKVTRETVYKTLRTIPNFEQVSKSLVGLRRESRLGKYYRRKEEVYRLLEQGVYAVNISKKLCIPYYIIKDMLSETNYDNSHASKVRRNEEIYKRYLNGETQTKLAKEYFVSQAQISDIIHTFTNEQFRGRPKIRS